MKEIGFIFFVIGVWGFVVRSATFITSLVGLEMLFVSVVYTFCAISIEIDDIEGQLFGICVLAVAAAESAVALAVLVQYYRVRGAVETLLYPTIKA